MSDFIKLNNIHRRGEGSAITENAARINAGRTDLINDGHFIVKAFDRGMTAEMADYAIKTLKANYKTDEPYKTQILSPIKEGPCGIFELNRLSKLSLNPSASTYLPYSVGDKVIFTINNYDYGYLNGDMGIVTSTSGEDITVSTVQEDISLPYENAEDAILSYAITIHKSQGGEYDNVIIMLPHTTLLRREVLYTAITRAKKNVIIIAEGDALNTAIKNDKKDARNSGLLSFLMN